MFFSEADTKAYGYLFRSTDHTNASRILQLGNHPIIIGGCGRSGTTLLLSILSCHPHIFAINEETRTFCQKAYMVPPDHEADFKLKKLFTYLLNTSIPATCTRWCEKTPKNVQVFQRILDYYGKNVRILNIVRDGRDVITSHHPSNSSHYWITADRWIADVKAGLQFDNHPQVKTIRYEDLISDYLPTVQSILSFLNEEFCQSFLQYDKETHINKNAAWFGNAKPIHSSSIGRWKKPEYKTRVSELLKKPEAIRLLKKYTYL